MHANNGGNGKSITDVEANLQKLEALRRQIPQASRNEELAEAVTSAGAGIAAYYAVLETVKDQLDASFVDCRGGAIAPHRPGLMNEEQNKVLCDALRAADLAVEYAWGIFHTLEPVN